MTSARTDLRGTPKVRRFLDSERSTDFWVALQRTAERAFGIDTGAAYVRALREAEHNFDFWNETFLGIKPLKWQSDLWNNGLQRKPYAVAMLGNSGGKMQPVTEPVLTPSGWREIGSLGVGDEVIGADGRPTRVLGVYPQGVKKVLQMTFDDDSTALCGEEHLWTVMTGDGRFLRGSTMRGRTYLNTRYQTRTTMTAGEIRKRWGSEPKARRRVSIQLVRPVEFSSQDVPMDPYLLGILIGDGSFTHSSVKLTSADPEIAAMFPDSISANVRRYDYTVRGMKKPLVALGLQGHRSWEKFVPAAYLWNSVTVRHAILQGLMDTGGSVDAEAGRMEYSTTSEQLADDVLFLVQSLGGKGTISSRFTKYPYLGEIRTGRRSYRVRFRLPTMNPFRLTRKACRWRSETSRTSERVLRRIEDAGEADSVCISVEAADGLYVTRDFVVTHNTVSFCEYYLRAGFWRSWSPEWWGVYRMLHHAPQEVQALETHKQIKEILAGTHRAQKRWTRTRQPDGTFRAGWEYKPCLIWPFVEAAKHDDGKHQGFNFLASDAMLTFRSTAFKAKASDGVDPYFIGEDEVRHELYLKHVVENIFLPRFLRVPKGRLYIPFTPLEASVEAVEFYERGATGSDPDWYAFNEDLITANPTVQQEDIDRLKRNTDKRLHKQILGGHQTQRVGARFQQIAVDKAYLGAREPDDLDALVGLRSRTMARCPQCIQQKAGVIGYKSHVHKMVGFVDPASSSATADAIVFKVWDLEPYWDGRIGDGKTPVCVFIKQAEAGTEEALVQNVAKYASKIAAEIQGTVGYDLNSALGHNVGDLLIDLDGDFIGLDKHTRDEKLKAVDFLKGLVDRGLWTSVFHAKSKAQMLAWQPDDKRIKQDFLMAEVGCAEVARPDLPDFITDPDVAEEVRVYEAEATGYEGFGDVPWGPIPDAAQDVYGPEPWVTA